MKLERIQVPLWSPPCTGPWGIRWTRPNGESGLSLSAWGGFLEWDDRGEAEYWAALCRRHCCESCTYVVVPIPKDLP